MKRIIALAGFFLAFSCTVSAQSKTERLKQTSSTVTNATTTNLTFAAIGSGVKGFQFTVTKLTGTVAGKVYLEATINGDDWIKLDSMTTSDQATNTKAFAITSTTYYSYRASYVSTGTQTSTLKAACMRRPDELY